MLGKVMDSIHAPAPGMSWIQLGAATIFVLVVAVGWRQVTLYIMREL